VFTLIIKLDSKQVHCFMVTERLVGIIYGTNGVVVFQFNDHSAEPAKYLSRKSVLNMSAAAETTKIAHRIFSFRILMQINSINNMKCVSCLQRTDHECSRLLFQNA
jgi:hypothetical protein